MKCPKCKSEKSDVIDSRNVSGGLARRRRRVCECGARYSTYETIGSENGNNRINVHPGAMLPFEELQYRSDVLLAIASMLDVMRTDGMKLSRKDMIERGTVMANRALKVRRKRGVAVNKSMRAKGKQHA